VGEAAGGQDTACVCERGGCGFYARCSLALICLSLPPYQTCHRRFSTGAALGAVNAFAAKLAEDLRDRGKLDLSESFIDASFSSAKKGGSGVGPTKPGKGSKIMAIADRQGLPVAVHVVSASAE